MQRRPAKKTTNNNSAIMGVGVGVGVGVDIDDGTVRLSSLHSERHPLFL